VVAGQVSEWLELSQALRLLDVFDQLAAALASSHPKPGCWRTGASRSWGCG